LGPYASFDGSSKIEVKNAWVSYRKSETSLVFEAAVELELYHGKRAD
jgi:hypothetical protein